MNKNNDNKIRLTFHPAEFGAKMPIPLAEQSVKAGFPSPAQDYMEGEIDLNDILVRHREATFYVRVSGDSMQDAGILDGDLAIVDRQILFFCGSSSMLMQLSPFSSFHVLIVGMLK
jgi:DNA polymerase V